MSGHWLDESECKGRVSVVCFMMLSFLTFKKKKKDLLGTTWRYSFAFPPLMESKERWVALVRVVTARIHYSLDRA